MDLAVKYRPNDFETFVGNEDVVNKIKSKLMAGNFPHTTMFVGASGCGKTTLARIVASKLKCGVKDLSEINASDFRGIDTVRSIIQKTQFKPISGKTRVFIIDEAHKLSNDAQNAFLKTLEEPPEYVYIMLCTTEPEKLLSTVRNRCKIFEVKILSTELIAKKVLFPICKAEKKKVPKEVLLQIADESLGSVRAAIAILEEIIDLPADKMKVQATKRAEIENKTIELCRALIKRESWKTVAKILSGLDEDPEKVRRAVLGYMSSVLLREKRADVFDIMCAFEKNFYDTGRAGLIMACFDALCSN